MVAVKTINGGKVASSDRWSLQRVAFIVLPALQSLRRASGSLKLDRRYNSCGNRHDRHKLEVRRNRQVLCAIDRAGAITSWQLRWQTLPRPPATTLISSRAQHATPIDEPTSWMSPARANSVGKLTADRRAADIIGMPSHARGSSRKLTFKSSRSTA